MDSTKGCMASGGQLHSAVLPASLHRCFARDGQYICSAMDGLGRLWLSSAATRAALHHSGLCCVVRMNVSQDADTPAGYTEWRSDERCTHTPVASTAVLCAECGGCH